MNDELAGLIAIIAVIVIVIGTLIAVGFYILAGLVIVGFISGFFVAGKNFFDVLDEAHKKMPFSTSVYMMEVYENLYLTQPATLMYPFGGGWQVMKYVQDNIFVRTQSSANFWYTKASGFKAGAEFESNFLFKYYKWMAYAGAQLAGGTQYISAFIFVAIFFVNLFLN